MITWREGTVRGVRDSTPEVLDLEVRLEPGGVVVRAIAYVELVGIPRTGDRVLLNTNALDRALGTGGTATVVAVPDRLPDAPEPSAGHVMKARYTPLQTMVLGVDEQESPHHDLLRDADDLDGMPVVTADLHSALPAVLAGLYGPGGRPDLTVAYVMTDGGALPASFSRTARGLADAGWLASTISVGQAFGGDLEAVNVHTGLLAARHVVGADVAIVAQGPGNLGTGTRWGFSGTSAGEAVNAAAALGGRAVASLRVSEGDARERHRGISHHSRTAYTRVALSPADLPVPLLEGAFGGRVSQEADVMVLEAAGRLRRVDVGVDGLDEALATSPVPLRTMGRGPDEDRASFVAAAAAGRHARSLVAG